MKITERQGKIIIGVIIAIAVIANVWHIQHLRQTRRESQERFNARYLATHPEYSRK